MGSPSYIALQRRESAKRHARQILRETIDAAWLALGDADIAADTAYTAEMARINAEACEAYEMREAA